MPSSLLHGTDDFCAWLNNQSSHSAITSSLNSCSPCLGHQITNPPSALTSTPLAILLAELRKPSAWRKNKCRPPLLVTCALVGGSEIPSSQPNPSRSISRQSNPLTLPVGT